MLQVLKDFPVNRDRKSMSFTAAFLFILANAGHIYLLLNNVQLSNVNQLLYLIAMSLDPGC